MDSLFNAMYTLQKRQQKLTGDLFILYENQRILQKEEIVDKMTNIQLLMSENELSLLKFKKQIVKDSMHRKDSKECDDIQLLQKQLSFVTLNNQSLHSCILNK